MQENRPRFVDLLFYILGADDGVTVVDYRAKPMHNVREAKKRFFALWTKTLSRFLKIVSNN